MRFRSLVALLCAAAPVVVGCGGGSTEGGQLRVGTVSKVLSLNPYKASAFTDYQLIPLLYPMLVQASPEGEMVPDLATEWKTSADGRTWTFTLHEDGKWSDGEPITAADAAFSINTTVKYSGSGAGTFAYAVANVKTAEAPDPATLVVRMSKPSAAFLNNLAGLFMLPEHVWSKYTKDKDGKALGDFANDVKPVAGGPFMVQRQTEETLLLRRNPGFYDPPAKIDGLGFRYFANDDALINALKANEIDLATNVAPSAVNALSDDKGIRVAEAPGGSAQLLYFNLNPDRTTHTELLDPSVRTAIDHAIDRQKVADIVYFGAAEPAGALIPPGFPGWKTDIEAPAFDLDEGNRILDEAGYEKGADGIRTADGERMSYEVMYVTSQQAIERRLHQILQEDFEQIGVELKPKAVDDAQILEELYADDGKTAVGYTGNATGTYDPEYLLNLYTCDSAYFNGGFNAGNFCDEEFDNLMELQRTKLEQGERKAVVDQLQEILATKRASPVIVYRKWIDAYATKWTGFEQSVFGLLDLYNHRSAVRVQQAS